MQTPPDRSGLIQLSPSQLQHPQLLAGLDFWLQLGLLTPEQVQEFCQTMLACEMPIAVEQQVAIPVATPSSDRLVPVALSTDFADAAPLAVPAAPAAPTHWMARSLQALMAEIGVIWLLCLGVFMVVVSSGVLAASQWRNFSAIGQYGILFTYTLAFWGVSLWAGRQSTLQLTARMLQVATLLIIPVNFWMMDGLRLWQSPIGIGVNGLAALVLGGILWTLMPKLAVADEHPLSLRTNMIGLSLLHWGWAIAGIPLVATYFGTIGTAFLTYRRVEGRSLRSSSDETAPESIPESFVESTPLPSIGLSLPTLIIGFATLLLVGRAILAAQVPLSQLGLALGICGWLFCWLARTQTQALANLWSKVGVGLLLIGWAITIAAEPPGQALAISGLGLWLIGDRLRRTGAVTSLIALLTVGLQAYALLWRVLPIDWRQEILATAAQMLGNEGMPIVLLSLAGFPYLWLMLGLSGRLRHRPHLAHLTDACACGLGSCLILISLTNPWVRSLTLLGSAATLGWVLRQRWVLQRQSRHAAWIYLCHSLSLAALLSWLDAYFPGFDGFDWARVLLVIMAIEWAFSLGRATIWRQSCWRLGLVLAGMSYVLLLANSTDRLSDYGSLVWLVTPTLLTGLAVRKPSSQAAGLSTGALLAQLLLLRSVETGLIAAVVATGLMVINTWKLPQLPLALVTIGFGLGTEATAINRFYPEWLNFEGIMLLLAGNLWLLWLLQDIWSRRSAINPESDLESAGPALSQHYAAAANLWAGGMALFSLISLSLHGVAAYGFPDQWQISFSLIISAALLTTAMLYHLWRQGVSEPIFYGLAWAIELLAVMLVGWQLRSIETLAIFTLGLGLVSQIGGDLWVRWSDRTYRNSWHGIPLLYAGLGLWLSHPTLTATTGLYTLAAALIGIGVGRRLPRFKGLTIASLILISIGLYELLVYQLLQASGGAVGDGVTLLAGLAALIAIGEWIGQRGLRPYLRLEANELEPIAHLHWGVGSGLALLAVPLGLSQARLGVWLFVMLILTVYALVYGRTNSARVSADMNRDRWTYFGILEALFTVSYLLCRLVPDRDWLFTWASILAAVIAVALYFLPWHSWGWSQRPWQRMAILLPGTIVILTLSQISLQSLLMVAAFYVWMAKAEAQPRLSYAGLAMFDWAAVRFLYDQDLLNLSWMSALLTLTLLYMAQLDPDFQGTSAKEQRHWLRSIAVGLLSLTLLYQAELETGTALTIRLLTLGWAIGLILLGLVLRVRAFLYIGTLTFVVQVLRVLWLFVNSYSLLLWAIGIVIGLLFIWIAATFEARRSQVSAIMQYWLGELGTWE